MNELQHKQINKRENDNFILNVPSTQNENFNECGKDEKVWKIITKNPCYRRN